MYFVCDRAEEIQRNCGIARHYQTVVFVFLITIFPLLCLQENSTASLTTVTDFQVMHRGRDRQWALCQER